LENGGGGPPSQKKTGTVGEAVPIHDTSSSFFLDRILGVYDGRCPQEKKKFSLVVGRERANAPQKKARG